MVIYNSKYAHFAYVRVKMRMNIKTALCIEDI